MNALCRDLSGAKAMPQTVYNRPANPLKRSVCRFLALLLAMALAAMPHVYANVTGTKNVVVLRTYFNDYANSSRYTKAEVQGFFTQLDTLWGTHNSYGVINISAQVSDLFKLPSNRSSYIDDFPDGDLSNGGKYMLVLNDAIANSPAGITWTNVDAVMVVMAETDTTQLHRGQGNKCTVKMGPTSGAASKLVGCAIFSENPGNSDLNVWGRWAHELGHAFQEGNPPHPSNYNSNFELMDASYPGQTGMFEKWIPGGFGGWMPNTKYKVFTAATGGGNSAVYAEEFSPGTKPNSQAVKADITASLYYLVSVRRRINGDELRDNGVGATTGIPDEGVLIERVVENGDASVTGAPWVVVQGKGGDRDKVWQEGDQFQNASDGMFIKVDKKVDDDNYEVTVRYSDGSMQPDVGMYSWISPPGNTYETTDIWIDSPVNGYGTFRYGSWSDLHGGTVPQGNGDDPAIGQVNRIYARVRNFGTLPATNVVVHFDITNPPGLGINGANGFIELGSANSTQFPGLASIPAGGTTDVYLEWTPNFTITPAQMAAGRFFFHTCLRVRIDHLAGEKVFGNQDGDGQQENIDYFQATGGPGAPPGAPYQSAIRLRNDDLVNKKYFYVNYKNDIPPGWVVEVNNGESGVELLPNEIRDIPIVIKQTSSKPWGSAFALDVSASSMRLLVNDRNPKDTHPEFKVLGGTRVEARVVAQVKLECRARKTADGIMIEGRLSGFPEKLGDAGFPVYLEGVDGARNLLPHSAVLVEAKGTAAFRGYLKRSEPIPRAAVCLFTGTDKLASASSGYIPIK
jgi:hypothetical protein